MGAGIPPRWAEAIALTSSLGFQFAVSVGAGCALGYAVDSWLGWKPVAFTILGGLAGFTAGLRWMVRSLAAFERKKQKQHGKKQKHGKAG